MLVLDYREAFNLLHEYLGRAHISASEEDIQAFFRWMLESYFLNKRDHEPRKALYDLFFKYNPQEGDYAELTGQMLELTTDIFEAIGQHIRQYLPAYGQLACGHGISDCNHRHATTYEVHLEPCLVQPYHPSGRQFPTL
jgi:hypothetical protein